MIRPHPEGSVACLAGRRIDPEATDFVRFPEQSEAKVREALSELFAVERVRRLVCSAACGADILALEAAATCGISATIVLPFSPVAFRKVSVADRPGDWGPRFDRLIARARADNMLIELGLSLDDPDAFSRANMEILSRAAAIPSREHLAVIVWDGEKVGEADITGHIRDLAQTRGFRILEVSTLP
jgi:hypothetical protein